MANHISPVDYEDTHKKLRNCLHNANIGLYSFKGLYKRKDVLYKRLGGYIFFLLNMSLSYALVNLDIIYREAVRSRPITMQSFCRRLKSANILSLKETQLISKKIEEVIKLLGNLPEYGNLSLHHIGRKKFSHRDISNLVDLESAITSTKELLEMIDSLANKKGLYSNQRHITTDQDNDEFDTFIHRLIEL